MSRYRDVLCAGTDEMRTRLNALLSGENLRSIKPLLRRMSRNEALPPWFARLETAHSLPNLDGKTVGSVVEKLLACVIEKYILDSRLELHINPAKGVDIPELELGIKSPSENFCTSEPYFSAYERLVGNDNDALILLTDYQRSKKAAVRTNGLRLQILDVKYLKGSEMADRNLCETAESLKKVFAGNDGILRRAIHFLAYINQGDWEAARLLELIQNVVVTKIDPAAEYKRIKADFDRKNASNERRGRERIPVESLQRIQAALASPADAILQAEGWVSRTLNENWHSPSRAVWQRIATRKLEGKIGMSFALQWRYNFGAIFRHVKTG